MIESAAARELVERLRAVEDRLDRVLASGWRQAGLDLADLRVAAGELAEAGLTEVAARVAAVADASGPAEALAAVALATSACRLLRARLPSGPAPEGWTPLAAPKPRVGSAADTLIPVARLPLDGREVWACARGSRGQWLLLEPPFPVEAEATAPPAPSGFLGRLRRQLDRALGDERAAPAPWMHHLLHGSLVWLARHPLGADHDVELYRLDRPTWETSPDTEHHGIQAFHQTLSASVLVSGAPVFPSGGGLRLVELHPDDAPGLAWLDPTAAEAFRTIGPGTVWTICWSEGRVVAPVAIVTRGRGGQPPRLTHLLPGLPEDVLSRPA